MYFANLYDGACVLFVTGLFDSFSLCVLIYILSFGAIGFILIRYFWFCFSIKRLPLYSVCWIIFLYLSVGFLFICFILLSFMNVSTFLFKVFVFIIIMSLFLSAFTAVAPLFCRIVFMLFKVY